MLKDFEKKDKAVLIMDEQIFKILGIFNVVHIQDQFMFFEVLNI